jgi:DNA-binding beta-propeller fold protein YncE
LNEFWKILGVQQVRASGTNRRSANVGEEVVMKWRKESFSILLAACLACLWASACGSKSVANQVVVTVNGSFSVMVPTQSQTVVATVTGATDVSSTFTCNYTTTPNPTTAVPSPKPSASATCESANGAVGVLSNVQNTSTTASSTATFTAPPTFPDQVKLPNVTVTITATSHADSKKTGTFSFTFDSGIRITISPATATLGTGETKQFFADDLTGAIISNSNLTWGVTFEATAKINSVSCGGGTNDCGSVKIINGIATYAAPAAVPTAAPASTTTPVNAAGIVTVFVFSNVDNARIAQAAVTIVKAGNIAFSGISPSMAPQGGLRQDIFLAATNATSQIGITLTGPSGNVPIDLANQVKVVFPAGTSTASIGVRLRLNSAQLAAAGHYTLGVSSSNPSITVTGGPFPLDIVPVRPTIVSSNPSNIQESSLLSSGGTPSSVPILIDGGFFGDSSFTTVAAHFNNLPTQSTNVANARQITGFLPQSIGTGAHAGLFPLSVQYSTSPGPFAAPTATTAYSNLAVIPDYGGSNPPSSPSLVTLPASSAPSAIALDPVLGVAIVTLAGANTPGAGTANVTNTANNVQFLNLAGGTPTPAALVSSQGFLATDVAVDDQLHKATVVNYASRTLSVLSVPAGTLLATVDLSGLIPPPVPPSSTFVQPFPYSVGIDPFSHRALVAFASTNVGLIINLDQGVTPTCILSPATSPYCPIAYVTLATGSNPHIAFEAGAHLAYVTPGGAGIISGVNLANPSTGSVAVASAARASNIVTVTTSTPHKLIPGNPGTVLVSGLPAGKNGTNFDGSFSVGNVLDANNFQYFQADKDDTVSCTTGCLASSGIPFLTYQVSPTVSGVAVNPVTRQAVIADPNATFSQINFIDAQSQSVTAMTLFAGAIGQVSTGSPELGATNVAFQPFSNTALSYNSKLNQLSFLDPSALQRLQFVSTGQTSETIASFTPAGSTIPITVNLSGALAVDAPNNVAMAVNSGSSNISVFKLGSIKSVHIERVQTPGIDSSSAGISVPALLTQAVKITLGTAPVAVSGVQIFGSGFDAGSKVHLDGTDITAQGGTIDKVTPDGREIDVTIPPFFLSAPRHFALDVVNSAGVGSNVTDFTVLEEIPIPACGTTPPLTPAAPGGVAIDEIHNLALVANTGAGCNQVSVISLNPANVFSQTVKTIATGATPTGIAVLPRLAYTGQPANTSGVAVVTNNAANTVSIIDPVNLKTLGDVSITDVAVGTAPSGVAIDQETNLAVIANTSSNTVSTIDLTPLTASPIGKLAPVTVAVDQSPIAVAIDPDRGTSGRGMAVVTCLILNGASAPFGALDVVDIGGTTPVKSSTASISGIQATPTGIVFDPSVVTGTTNPGLFYAVSTQSNQITTFNPDNSSAHTIQVGINPTAIAHNFQTGTMLTVNSLSNTISIVDSQTFRTKETLGIGAKSNFTAAIQTFTNLAVIADQANNRVLLLPLPN